MNVAGHRLSTYEIESALVDDPKVAEAAVVSRPDDLVGEAIVAFVTLKSGFVGDEAMAGELREHVAEMIGKIARPHGIIFTADLPKTRSGKIMRRLLRDVARGRPLGDVTTLANAEIVEQINTMVESGAGTSEWRPLWRRPRTLLGTPGRETPRRGRVGRLPHLRGGRGSPLRPVCPPPPTTRWMSPPTTGPEGPTHGPAPGGGPGRRTRPKKGMIRGVLLLGGGGRRRRAQRGRLRTAFYEKYLQYEPRRRSTPRPPSSGSRSSARRAGESEMTADDGYEAPHGRQGVDALGKEGVGLLADVPLFSGLTKRQLRHVAERRTAR